MEINCAHCGKTFQPQRRSAKYCGTPCRTRATRARAAAGIPVTTAAAAPAPAREHRGLVESVESALGEANRLATWAGRQALLLADRLESGSFDTGSAAAAVSKELRAVMAEALGDVEEDADPVDELRRRREAKRGVG